MFFFLFATATLKDLIVFLSILNTFQGDTVEMTLNNVFKVY